MRKNVIVIAAAVSIMQLLAACGAAGQLNGVGPDAIRQFGLVTGKFERVGGPLGPGGKQPPVVPLRGTVTFTAAHHRVVRVQVGHSGRFTVRLDPGRYQVTGRTPDIEGPGGVEAMCRGPVRLIVSVGHARSIKVICAVP